MKKINIRRLKHKVIISHLLLVIIALQGIPKNANAQVSKQTNTELAKITDPADDSGLIHFKPELNLNPETIFTDYRSAFGLKSGFNMRLYKTAVDHEGNIHYCFHAFLLGVKHVRFLNK